MIRERFVMEYPDGRPAQPGEGKLVSRGEVLKPISGGMQIISDIDPYASPIDDSYVGSRRDRREDLKRNGCRPFEKGEVSDFNKDFHKEQDAKLEKVIDSAVDEVAGDLFA